MRKVGIFVLGLFMVLGLAACGTSEKKADYDTKSFEAALNKGKDLTGKTVSVDVVDLKPDGAFGYTIWAGEHLNFVSPENPNVKKGDTIVVKVTKVASTLGSYIITYDKE